ncbi:gamma-glutamyl hydrolase-like [Tubulanus polymorphus]|uniref:gamma-glutamyl hydrolase-like n=1 Tax=Tubulanus polymorphus TaxID=672921 RepID=UPI003DA5ADE6
MTTIQVNIGPTAGVLIAVIVGIHLQYQWTFPQSITQHDKQTPIDAVASSSVPPVQQSRTVVYTPTKTNQRHHAGNGNDASTVPPEINERPIIGMLTQNCIGNYKTFGKQVLFPNNVKWMQGSGAQVVPIWADQSEEYYEKMFKQINGLYLPGGLSTSTNSTYFRSARVLLKLAIKENDRGVYFPVWGVCLGLQFFLSNIAQRDITYQCPGQMFHRTQLYKGEDFEDSFLKKILTPQSLTALEERNFMPHMHKRCVSKKAFYSIPELQKLFKIVSINTDGDGIEYISTIESRKYPFYATQWHPEKYSYHWNVRAQTPHSSSAIKIGHEIGNFFVAESRRNNHKFVDPTDEEALLINNYQVVVFGSPGYASYYFFQAEDITEEGLRKRKEKLVALRNMKVSMNAGDKFKK